MIVRICCRIGGYSPFDNTIEGCSGDNILCGLGGNDRLDGGGGADTKYGSEGNDEYVVDNENDQITEDGSNADQGIYSGDRVQSTVNWILGANLENPFLQDIGEWNEQAGEWQVGRNCRQFK